MSWNVESSVGSSSVRANADSQYDVFGTASMVQSNKVKKAGGTRLRRRLSNSFQRVRRATSVR